MKPGYHRIETNGHRSVPLHRLLHAITAGVMVSLLSAACAPFDVNVGTNEPLKVDLSMEVHVYQHGEPDEEAKEARKTYKEVMTRRRNRMEEVQNLKNNRLVVETHQGTLDIRSLPAGEVGTWVKETVESENKDRVFLMQHEAEEKSLPLGEIRRMQWRHWQRKSFPGEYIEVEGEGPGEYLQIQKKKAGGETGQETSGAEAEIESDQTPE